MSSVKNKSATKLILILLTFTFCLKIYGDLREIPTLDISNAKGTIFARDGTRLTHNYGSFWNDDEKTAINDFPDFLIKSVIYVEDRRFYNHVGFDPYAIGGALWNLITFSNAKRGASTISEQVVKMFNPRKRTFYTKLVELLEAYQFEKSFSKKEILEFYLNQVPLPKNTRGFTQAARKLYGRSLSSLSKREILALVASLVAPGKYRENNQRIDLLAKNLIEAGILKDLAELGSINFIDTELEIDNEDFIRFARTKGEKNLDLKTSLDLTIQNRLNQVLSERLKQLSQKNVENAAGLVVDNRTHQILAWVSKSKTGAGADIDGVMALRQPGSTLKPFLYMLAIQKGWYGGTVLNDAPLKRGVSGGIKDFKNYSQTYYGKIPLRKALGNSLNTPAVRTINFVGVEDFYNHLHQFGFDSLNKGAYFYGEGLALGDGEVSLYELVRAYSALANGGRYSEITPFANEVLIPKQTPTREYQVESSYIISDILTDSKARELEFGSLLFETPYFLAVKTGTSSDYRDAWTVGFNKNFTVGLWFGNLSGAPTKEVSGASGVLVALRTIFSSLDNTDAQIETPEKVKKVIDCNGGKSSCNELEILGRENLSVVLDKAELIEYPKADTIFAINSRFDLSSQSIELKGVGENSLIWLVDDEKICEDKNCSWDLKKGAHSIEARSGGITQKINILVK